MIEWKRGIGMGWLAAGSLVAAEPGKNHYTPYPRGGNIESGISWPKGQALPIFATPAATLDTLALNDLSKDEQLAFSALQGIVNRKQPRILIVNKRAEEGAFTWADTAGIGEGSRKLYDRDNKYELMGKYAAETGGIVLYDHALSPHYRNLAATVAAIQNAIPVTAEIRDRLVENGVELKTTADLTDLKFTTATEVYQYMLDRYWDKCDKRLIVSAKPHDERGGGNYHHARDIAAAAGAATVWLNTLIPAEREVLGRFFSGMKAGEGIALGWYTTERTGITTATKYGIGTLPADFYVSGSVYSGTDHAIKIPPVPKMPALENKVYIAIFISDGDNIQYTQHAMRKNWERTADSRGKVPLNWTIAPGLVDIGPVIMNHYYSTATPADCFVTGPSGMGYIMPYNTLKEPGAPTGDYLTDPARMEGYAKLTETYLQRSGLRVVTIWDDATPMQRASYAKHCRSLYGATVQNFKDVPSVAGSVEAGRVRFEKLVIPYTGSYEHIRGSLDREIGRWDGKQPLFLAYQVDVWGQMRANRIVDLHDDLQKAFPGKIEFTRADHYFNLYNQAEGLPFNLALSPATTVTGSGSQDERDRVLDGTPVTVWSADGGGNAWLGFDFGRDYQISRYVVRHAGDAGMDPGLNTAAYFVKASADGKTWKTVGEVNGNKVNVTDMEIPAVRARYMKLEISDPGADGVARVADMEIYGRN